MSATGSCYYVYGIVDADSAAQESPLRAAVAGPLAAVYEELDPDDLSSLGSPAVDDEIAQLAVKHDAVVRRLAERGATLPMRMGTVWPELTSLVALLQRESATLLDALDHVRSCSEWQLRVHRIVPRAQETDAAYGTASGREYLLNRRDEQRRAAMARRPLSDDLDTTDGSLVALSRGVVSRTLPDGGIARAYLVAADDGDAFVDMADRVLEELTSPQCVATLRGPLPAYSFVDVALEVQR
jgi:hypothetical protein